MRHLPKRLLVVLIGIALTASSYVFLGCGTGGLPTGVVIVTGAQDATPFGQQLRDAIVAQEAASTDLLAMPGVVGTGASLDAKGKAVVVVLVESASTSGIPTKIGGLPVQEMVTGTVKPFALTGSYRPAPIGVSVGNANECLPGTIGCVLMRGNSEFLLSANHVFARQNQATIGESIIQPSLPDLDPACGPSPAGAVIARLSDFEPVVYDGRTANLMDAAIAQVTMNNNAVCSTPQGFYGFPSATVASPAVGMAIMKVGRTTELTRGDIKSVNVKVKITFPSGTALFADQILTSKAFGGFGDSGSLVVTDDGTRRPVGMLIGGTNVGVGIVTPIGPILSRFGATVCSN